MRLGTSAAGHEIPTVRGKLNSKISALGQLVIVAVLLCAAVLLVTACGGDDESEDEVPTPSVIPTAVRPTAAAPPVSGRVSLDEYTKVCAGLSLDGATAEEEDFTYRDVSELFGKYIDQFEAVEPPAEVAAWHRAVLAYQRAIKKVTDDYPAPRDSEVSDEFLLEVLFPAGLELQPAIDAALRDMATDTRDRLLAANCIEEDAALEGEADGATSPTELTVGMTHEATLDRPGQPIRFSFPAQQGQRFLFEVAKRTLPDFAFNMPFSDTHRVVILKYAEGRERLSVRWTAPSSDTYYVQVWPSPEDSTGTFSILVRFDLSPDSPKNVRYAAEGSNIRVTWEAVDGADYYKVYYDDFAPEGCKLDEDGNPKFCEELAARVDETTFVHTRPDERKNFYWVVACNSDGCSVIPLESAKPA